MSSENQDLQFVRGHSTARSPIAKSKALASRAGTAAMQEFSPPTPRGCSTARDAGVETRYYAPTTDMGGLQLPVAIMREREARQAGNQFASKASSFTGPSDVNWAPKSSYADQHSASKVPLLHLGFKNDARFQWKPGCGTPRPQTTLIKIQNGFSRSGARKKFHQEFYEMNPDLRENILDGRQHQFGGVNAQVMRGTPVDAY